MRRNKDLSHDHEWLREPSVDWDEDIFVTWNCNWAEVTSAVTSERHDETFYGYGAECAATKTAVYGLVVETADDGSRLPWGSERAARVCETLYLHHSTDLIETVEQSVDDPYTPHEKTDGVRVKLDHGDRYYVYGELDKVTVDEDWE